MAIARMLLVLSSALGILLGLLFFSAGVYCLVNTDLLNKYVNKLDLRSVPKAAALKRDIIKNLEESGIVQTAAGILVMIGLHATFLSSLGIVVSVADSRIYAKFYIVVNIMTILGSLAVMLLLTVGTSIIEKPIQDRVLETLNRKFVSIVALFENKAGDGMAVTVVFNYIQLQFGCCGIRKVGDIRGSRRWKASPRALAGMMKLRPGGDKPGASEDDDKGQDKKGGAADDGDTEDETRITKNRVPKRKLLVVQYSDIPEWLKEHVPAGAALPDGANLPTELPDGIVIPRQFQLTQKTLQSGESVNKAFEDSLLLRTPVTCCRFKGKTSVTTLDARTLVSRMVDPTCPFEAKNTVAVHNKTCHEKVLNYLNQHSFFLLIGGCALGLYLSFNLCLAIQILLHG